MDLQNIQDQLNTEFAKDSTKYIFWFDDKAEYEDEVSELQLGDVKLHILDGTNWFYSKYLLNEEDTESKYLIYAPFPRPSDAENPLADMYYYSVPYYTDRVSQTSQEMGIDNRFKEQLSQYTRFWKNKNNIEKFKNLGIDHFNQQTIDIGLIAVLVDVKTPNFEEITKQMILGDSAKYMKALTDNGITDKFWELCNLFFGYQSDKPSIEDLAASMIVTYAASSLKGTVPTVFKPYILKKRNDVVVFIRNIMDNRNLKESYDALAEKVNKTLRFAAKVQEDLKKDNEKSKDRSLQLVDIFACDAFAGFDDIIIEWALSQLDDEILDSQIDGLTIAQIADQRSSMAYHYCDTYKYEYRAIKFAYMMMKSVALMEFTSDIKVLVENYQKETYLIDSYYRWFYHAYDKIEDNSRFSNVRERVENIYANTYLQAITPKWNENFTIDSMEQTGLLKQEDFYKHYLKSYDSKQRVIVIISDAFRYECARELFGRLELDEKCTPKMECMLSCLPSVTSVGMASLLPHKEMNVTADMTVTVDGQACASMEQRDKILKAYNAENVALSFDEVANANQAKIRELIQGKNIVYIYHNQVDARGDKAASENEVFNACAEAIDEIHRLIKRLTGYVSAPKFFITADHGFLYKRDKLQEFDKVSYPKDKCLYTNKRFIITLEPVNEQGVMARTMAYMQKLYVDTPVGADIFKVAGGGQNYVHGGTALQEMMVPVIELTTNTRGVAYDFVNVVLTSVSRKVTNLITYFDFIQSEKVTDTMKARSIIAYFTDEAGEKISFDVPIVANSRDDAPEKRTFHEKFTLKSREYKYGDKYYMVLADANDEKNILQKYEFMIDIAFVDDFGF
jgi:uncharacterized protein (TIGR02687 family)